MQYQLGSFTLDLEKEILILESTQVVVSDNPRVILFIKALINTYPKIISKQELLEAIWPKHNVTEWALTRLISDTRQLLAAHDSAITYIKTIHRVGFKLEVEPIPLHTDQKASQIAAADILIKNTSILQKSFWHSHLKKILLICGSLLLVSIFYFANHRSSPNTIYGSIQPAKTIPISLTSGWEGAQNSFRYSEKGVDLLPLKIEEVSLVRHKMQHPGFLQGAIYSLSLDVTPNYVGPRLVPNIQVEHEGWPGEWDCEISLDQLKTEHLDYHCIINENSRWTNFSHEVIIFAGLQIPEEIIQGAITIKSASLQLLPSIATHAGWVATNHAPITYDNGVSYKPKSSDYHISTTLKGPLNIKGSKLAFTIEMDDVFRKTKATIVWYLFKNNTAWAQCTKNVEAIESYIFTYVCDLKTLKDPFVLSANETVNIGIQPHGDIVGGTLKIIGITVME
jgi:DNA-binding winged helix-turn-helix (wHTH) protein